MLIMKQAYTEACAAIKVKDFEKANEIFKWMDENPSLDDPSSEMFRRANGFLSWALLANTFSPAFTSIQDSLKEKHKLINTGIAPPHLIADVKALQAALEAATTE